MHELHTILDAWQTLSDSNRDAVLATVVHVTGSAYRRPGARMLILPDGRRIGSISGGCLEGDVSRKAWWFTEGGQPSVRVYDTSSDEDAVWEFGLGCNGMIHVMLERVTSDKCVEALQFLWACRASSEAAVVATVIRTHGATSVAMGDRLFVAESGNRSGPLIDTTTERTLQPFVEQTAREQKSRMVRLEDTGGGWCEVFLEFVGPPPALVIFGAGHDAIPVVALAKSLGWNVTVADGRANYATAARFPQADRVVVMQPGKLLNGIQISEQTLVVMMTHNYPQDVKLLPGILKARPRYLGLLGPKRRAEKLFAEIGESMSHTNAHAPIGLDIGAETAEGIALSILSEMQAELAGRPGMKLRHRQSPIHAPVVEHGDDLPHRLLESEDATCEIA